MLWFIDHDETYWLDIRLLQQWRDLGNKSVPFFPKWVDFTDETDKLWTPINGQKRRVLFDYNFEQFFKDMEYYGK
jgi:hypothetical protein